MLLTYTLDSLKKYDVLRLDLDVQLCYRKKTEINSNDEL